MLLMNMLIPAILLGFGAFFRNQAPGKINWVFGYRTRRSMKNADTWTFAHQYLGRIWVRAGWILLAATVVLMLAVLFAAGNDQDTVGLFGSVIMCAQMIPLLGSVAATERALKRAFDEDGNRRDDQTI